MRRPGRACAKAQTSRSPTKDDARLHRATDWRELRHAIYVLTRIVYLQCWIWLRSIAPRPIYLVEIFALMALALIVSIVLGWIRV